jgi:hypothetical protein
MAGGKKAYKLAPLLLKKQCGTKYAHLRSWAIQIGPGVAFIPKEPDILIGPTHSSSADPYAMLRAPS